VGERFGPGKEIWQDKRKVLADDVLAGKSKDLESTSVDLFDRSA
jgi:hypothetical protein